MGSHIMKMLGVEQLLKIFKAVCLAYIGICIIQGYRKTEKQRRKESENTGYMEFAWRSCCYFFFVCGFVCSVCDTRFFC